MKADLFSHYRYFVPPISRLLSNNNTTWEMIDILAQFSDVNKIFESYFISEQYSTHLLTYLILNYSLPYLKNVNNNFFSPFSFIKIISPFSSKTLIFNQISEPSKFENLFLFKSKRSCRKLLQRFLVQRKASMVFKDLSKKDPLFYAFQQNFEKSENSKTDSARDHLSFKFSKRKKLSREQLNNFFHKFQ